MRRVRFSLELSLRTDFADTFEVNAKRLARILIKSVSITRHLGEVLPSVINDGRPIIGFASSCFGFYLVGTSTGAPLSFTKNTTNFAGLVWLAFRPTT
jgi:hypothetical protein